MISVRLYRCQTACLDALIGDSKSSLNTGSLQRGSTAMFIIVVL